MSAAFDEKDALTSYAALLRKWSSKINLVSRGDLERLEERHIQDSAQVFHVKHEHAATWLDVGSGGGLPAIVCAILAKQANHPTHFTLVESDQRKATFLRTAIRELDLDASVIAKRIEAVHPSPYDIISARALASLAQLFEWTTPFATPQTTFLLPKGATWRSEVEAARQSWKFDYDVVNSVTQADSVILKVKEVRRD
ncbi:16S rRNA (guanine(527)-N(7))-methyltransferase RsmG [Pseudaestuariivita sp.]|uniref:16S rRNA (guanine(527)-N(7))-methyltransferase RsmG n=1 Tax=Pseudaestuariivita sp. TaxID=2211669 RepID=UPI004058A5B8